MTRGKCWSYVPVAHSIQLHEAKKLLLSSHYISSSFRGKKGQLRLYFLKKLFSFNFDPMRLLLFRIAAFGTICRFQSEEPSEDNRNPYQQLASRREDIRRSKSLCTTEKLLSGIHFFYFFFTANELLPSDQRNQYPALKWNRTKRSFVPQVNRSSIKHLGNHL